MAEENFADQINAANAPFAKMIGVTMTLATKDRLEGEILVAKEHCTIPDTMHGGAIMAFADNMGGVGAFMNIPPGSMTSTIESKTNFLRPIPMGQKAKAVTTPVNIGRTLQLWKTEIYRDDGKLAAVVQQTQIVKDRLTKMYNVKLDESYFQAMTDAPREEITIGEMLRRQAAKAPDREALKELTYDGEIARVWTYGALLRDAERLARALASRHQEGARIAVYANNLPEWVLLELACGLAGVILVTVNPAYQKRELKYVLEQSEAEGIYYVADFRGNPMQEIADAVCDEIPAIKHRILLTDHDALFAGEDSGEMRDPKPGDPVQIQYTSGTTGFPKGALLHHHGLVQNGFDTVARGGVREGDLYIQNMPLFHTTGCAILVLGGFGIGATMMLAPMFDPVAISKAIERERPRFIFGVPTMLVALIDEAKKSGRDLSSIECIISGGAMVAPELCRAAKETFGANVQIAYGQTETSPVITCVWPDDSLEDSTETIGQPMPHVEVSIRNPQTNDVTPCGVQGEICCRGYLVMTGYYQNPEATAATIDNDGWLHTGDLGTMDARGFIKITGRVKEMIIRGGENLFPAEIENAMLEHDALAEVAVVGVPDEKWGEQVACFMRPGGDARPEASEMKAFIRDRLSPQKTPAFWIYVDEWPLTGSGKIQKFKLREGFEADSYNILTA